MERKKHSNPTTQQIVDIDRRLREVLILDDETGLPAVEIRVVPGEDEPERIVQYRPGFNDQILADEIGVGKASVAGIRGKHFGLLYSKRAPLRQPEGPATNARVDALAGRLKTMSENHDGMAAAFRIVLDAAIANAAGTATTCRFIRWLYERLGEPEPIELAEQIDALDGLVANLQNMQDDIRDAGDQADEPDDPAPVG